MKPWFEGTFGGLVNPKHRFEIYKHEKETPLFTLKLNGWPEGIEEVHYGHPLDPFKGTQCFQIAAGMLLFPWRWGHDSSDWPRFQSNTGEISLIKLSIERGQAIDINIGQLHLMSTIRGILTKTGGKDPVLLNWPRKG